jgi:hypothetical protein
MALNVNVDESPNDNNEVNSSEVTVYNVINDESDSDFNDTMEDTDGNDYQLLSQDGPEFNGLTTYYQHNINVDWLNEDDVDSIVNRSQELDGDYNDMANYSQQTIDTSNSQHNSTHLLLDDGKYIFRLILAIAHNFIFNYIF